LVGITAVIKIVRPFAAPDGRGIFKELRVMSLRTFARVFGVAFLLVGIMGFIPPLLTQPTDHPHGQHGVTVTAFEGYLLGLFHVNILHSLVHVLFGVMGLAMARRFDTARLYARIVAVSYLLLAVMGLIPRLDTVFGLIPIHGHDVWLHLLLGGVAAYFGFVARDSDTTGVGGVNPV
jgi:hypothetical protein